VKVFEFGVPCPVCGHTLDAVRSPFMEGDTPRPGDMTICFKCAAVLTFDEPPAVHIVTEEEKVKLTAEELEDLLLAQHMVQAVMRQ
jgi:C4-type Zn-finger protein